MVASPNLRWTVSSPWGFFKETDGCLKLCCHEMGEQGTWCLSCERIHFRTRVKVKSFYAFIAQMRKLRQRERENSYGWRDLGSLTPPNPATFHSWKVSEWGCWNKLGLHLQHAMPKGKHRIPSKGLEGTFIQMTIFQSRVRSPPRVHKWIPGFSVIIIIKLSVSILSLKKQQSKLSVKGLPWWSSG